MTYAIAADASGSDDQSNANQTEFETPGTLESAFSIVASSSSTKQKSKDIRVNTSALSGKSCKDLYSNVAKILGWREIDVMSPPCFGESTVGCRSKKGPPTVFCVMQVPEMLHRVPLSKGSWATRFSGFPDLCEKGNFARMAKVCKSILPDGALDFNPQTWLIPEEEADLRKAMHTKTGRTFIVKPEDGSQGDGIFLAQGERDFVIKMQTKNNKSAVAQRYLERPLLINGFKFDFRVYVLFIGGSSERPPRVLLCREGLARFCTEQYEKPSCRNLHKCMGHLTNYSLNKRSELFEHSGETEAEVFNMNSVSSKRPLSIALRQVKKQYPGFDAEQFDQSLVELVRTTAAMMTPVLVSAASGVGAMSDGQMRSCQVLGYDVIMDESFTPFLLEINNAPSLAIDEVWPLEPEEIGLCTEKFGSSTVKGALDTPIVCKCMEMGQPHFHRTSLVDLLIKQIVVAGLFRFLDCVNRSGFDADLQSDDFIEVDVTSTEVTSILARFEYYFERAGGPTKALTGAGLRRIFTPVCGYGRMEKTDLDILSKKFRQTKFNRRENSAVPDAMRFFEFLQVACEIANRAFPDLDSRDAAQSVLDVLADD